MEESTDTIDFGESSKEEKEAQIEKDRKKLAEMKISAEEIAQGLAPMKQLDEFYE